jgi:hypothetical protein
MNFSHTSALCVDGGEGQADSTLGRKTYPTGCFIGVDKMILGNDIWPISNLGAGVNTILTNSNVFPMQCSFVVNQMCVVGFNAILNLNAGNQINIALGDSASSLEVLYIMY